MSLHYLLDGYNILHQMPLLKPQKIEDERLNFVRQIEGNRPQGSLSNGIAMVFDGYGNADERLISPTVKVIYSQGRSADETIKGMVSSAGNKKTIIVVTNDRAIQYAVRAEGAKVCRVDEFLGKMGMVKGAQKSKSVKKDKESSKSISHVMEHNITSEFERIWVRKNDKKS